jgi:predicted acyltransferase
LNTTSSLVRTSTTAVSNGDASAASLKNKPSRLLSLDLLRGLDIGFMILVNDNADERAYWPLKHAEWNGFTPTDLVFPTFLFLVGISTVLSLSSRLSQGVTKTKLLARIFRRAAILYLLGLVVNSFPFFHLSTMRFYGVLPRIAICYLLVAVFYLISPGWKSKAVVAATALIGYWILMRFVPVPGYGIPTHGVPLLDRDGNLTAWIDRQLFSASHLYERTRDPEGLLSTIPAVGTALLGMITGIWLRSTRALKQKANGIAIAGLSSVLLGGLWNLSFPINKKLWTSSFVLFAGGFSMLLLAASIWLIDVPSSEESKSQRSQRSPVFTPLLVFGTNAIAAYALSELLASGLPNVHVRRGVDILGAFYQLILGVVPHDPALSSLIYSLCYVLMCWIPIYIFYRRKIFIKI